MTSGSVLKLVESQSKSEYYVYFDEWTGAIYSISRTELEDSDYPHILTDSYIVENILKGFENEKNFIVALTEDNEFDVIKKDNVFRLRSSEKTLRQISRKKTADWDIRIKIYTGNNKMMVEINQESIRRLSSMTFNKTVQIDSDNDLNLYVTKYNNPDIFISKIEVDVQELLENGNNVFDISNFRKHISLQDIGILTRRCFKNYYLEIVPDSLGIVTQSLIKNRSFIHRKSHNNISDGHITANQQGNIVTFRTQLSSSELSDIGLHEEKLWVYLVGETPDAYYGSIPINVRDLKNKKYTRIKIEGSLRDFNILHKKHRLILTVKES